MRDMQTNNLFSSWNRSILGNTPIFGCVVLSFALSKLWHTASSVDGAISTSLDVSNHILYLKWMLCDLRCFWCVHEGSYQWINDPKMCKVHIDIPGNLYLKCMKVHPKTCSESLVKEGGTFWPKKQTTTFSSPFYRLVIWGSFRMNPYTWSLLLKCIQRPLPALGAVMESASNRI